MPTGRKKKARFSDVSVRAGVGIATVDRVLNNRGNVSAKTALKVIQAARELHVNRLLPLPHRSHVRYKLICARPRDRPFVERLNQAFKEAIIPFSSSVTLERSFVDEDRPQALADEINRSAGHYNGLILLPVDDAGVRKAVDNVSKTIPVVTIISDVQGSSRLAFVGVDNYRAGRTAAFLASFGRTNNIRAAVVWQGNTYSGQLSRVQGFQSVYAEKALDGRLSTHEIHLPDPGVAYRFVRTLLEKHPEISVLYNAGLHDESIAEALVAEGQNQDICFIGHELTEANIALMKEGTIDFLIDQDPKQQAKRAMDLLLFRDGIIEKETLNGTPEFRIYCRENLQTT